MACIEGDGYLSSRASAQPLMFLMPDPNGLFQGCQVTSLSIFPGNVYLKTASKFFGKNCSWWSQCLISSCQVANILDHQLGRVTACLGDPHKSCCLQNTMFSEPKAFYKITWDLSQILAERLEFLSPIFQLD